MKINNISFKGNIIDSHAHIGKWYQKPDGVYDFGAKDLDCFIKQPLASGDTVQKMLVSNLDCLFEGGKHADEQRGNSKILQICANNHKLSPLAVCQPSLTNGNADIIEKLLIDNQGKFVGLKFHPESLNLLADSPLHDTYMKLAEKYNLPCLFHCQDGLSSPEAIYKLAQRHSKVPVIMGHMGAGGNHKRAIDILMQSIDNKNANLFADISWVDWGQNGLSTTEQPHVIEVIEKLKNRNALDRLLFGSDAPVGCFGEELKEGLNPKQAYEKTVSDLKFVIKEKFGSDADEILDKIFFKNAEKLFFKTKSEINTIIKENIPHKSSSKKIWIISTIFAVLGAGFYYFKNESTKKTTKTT